MKTRLLIFGFALAMAGGAGAQSPPKTADITEDVAPDGSVNMGFQMTFDAAPWRQWKAMVGDEPARLRAMMRHQFAAFTLEDFKLERDDMNRVAKMTMHSPVGPELRDDGTYQVPVDGAFRLINNAGRTWYFSGNNPQAGNSLNNVKVTLPANAGSASVVNPNSADQALVFALAPAPAPSRWLTLGGAVALLAGGALLLAGLLTGRRTGVMALPAAMPQAALPPPFAQGPPPFQGAAQPPPFPPAPPTPVPPGDQPPV